MSRPTATVIEPIKNGGTSDGIAPTESDVKGSNGNPSGDFGPPEPTNIGDFEVIEPRTVPLGNAGTGSDFDSGNGQRKRRDGAIDGRTKAGRAARTGTQSAPSSNDLIKLDIADIVSSVHLMLAKITDIEEIELTDAEAKKLADATKEVAKHYALEVDPKKLAWFNLMGVCGVIYVPRVFALIGKQKAAKPAKIHAVPKSAPTPEHKPDIEVSTLTPSMVWPQNGSLENQHAI